MFKNKIYESNSKDTYNNWRPKIIFGYNEKEGTMFALKKFDLKINWHSNNIQIRCAYVLVFYTCNTFSI